MLCITRITRHQLWLVLLHQVGSKHIVLLHFNNHQTPRQFISQNVMRFHINYERMKVSHQSKLGRKYTYYQLYSLVLQFHRFQPQLSPEQPMYHKLNQIIQTTPAFSLDIQQWWHDLQSLLQTGRLHFGHQ